MKSRFLFSHKYKPFGWILFLAGLIFGVLFLIFDFEIPALEVQVFPLFGDNGFLSGVEAFHWGGNNITDEIATLLIVVGGILVAFSKTKDEDEYISIIRMESLIWATYVNYIVLIIATLLVFILSFFFSA